MSASASLALLALFARLSLLLMVLFAAVIGAMRLEAQPDRDLLNRRNCSVSCWQGLEPGETSESDALGQMNALYGIEPVTSNCIDEPPPNDCALYTWRGEGAPRTTELTVDHGIVQSVMIYPAGDTLGEVLLALNAEFSGAGSGGIARGFAMQLVFAQSRFTVTLSVPCPLSYAALLRRTVNAIAVGLPANPQSDYPQSFAAVRRLFHQRCGG